MTCRLAIASTRVQLVGIQSHSDKQCGYGKVPVPTRLLGGPQAHDGYRYPARILLKHDFGSHFDDDVLEEKCVRRRSYPNWVQPIP